MLQKIFRIIDEIYSIIICCIIWGFKVGLKVPILISRRTKVFGLKRNCITINGKINRHMIRFGYGGSKGVVENCYSMIYISNGKIVFNGKANFGEGCSLRIDSGILEFGNNFYSNKNCFYRCSDRITIGNNVIIGWNTSFNEDNGHKILNLDDTINAEKLSTNIFIGNHCWIGADVMVTKGVRINDNIIVAQKSLLNKRFEENNIILGGIPAKVLRKNINWEL